MHELLLREQFFLAFAVIGIVHAAIHRTYSCALGLIVETGAFGTLVRHDVVDVHGLGRHGLVGIEHGAHGSDLRTMQGRAIREAPFHAAFIDGIVGTLRFACTTIDAFVCDHDRHERAVYFCGLVRRAKIADRNLGDERGKG